MPRLVLDYDADITKVARKTTELEAKLDDWADNIQLDMKRIKNATGLVTQGFEIYGKVIETVRGSAERLGRTDLPNALDQAAFSGQRLADSLMDIKVPTTGLTAIFPQLVGTVKDLTGGMIDLRSRSVIDWFTDAANGANNLFHVIGALGIQFKISTGQISYEAGAKELNAMMTDYAAEKDKKLKDDKQSLIDATKADTEAQRKLQQAIGDTKSYRTYEDSVKSAKVNISKLTDEIKKLQAENGKAKFSTGEIKDMELDYASANLDAEEANKANWEAQGKLTEAKLAGRDATFEEKDAAERANIALERAVISRDRSRESLEQARKATIDNRDAIADLNIKLGEERTGLEQASSKAVDARTAFFAYAEGADEATKKTREFIDAMQFMISLGNRLPELAGGGSGGSVFRNSRGPTYMAAGGEFMPGDRLIINESAASRPETVITDQSGGGQVLTRQQMGALMAGASGGLSIGNVNINNGMDLAAFKQFLRNEWR